MTTNAPAGVSRDSVMAGDAMRLLDDSGSDFAERLAARAWEIARERGSYWMGGPGLYLKLEHVQAALAHADKPSEQPGIMNGHDWLQIEQAANGCVSGTLKEWPYLNIALRKQGRYLDQEADASHMRWSCQEILKTRKSEPAPQGNCPKCGVRDVDCYHDPDFCDGKGAS